MLAVTKFGMPLRPRTVFEANASYSCHSAAFKGLYRALRAVQVCCAVPLLHAKQSVVLDRYARERVLERKYNFELYRGLHVASGAGIRMLNTERPTTGHQPC